ncbi:MAG TPA: hypothetical protein VEK15_09900 [Vicinamibacteria bacterium]|nr:hypothetical protein [Vicinamibacteria bacterium]
MGAIALRWIPTLCGRVGPSIVLFLVPAILVVRCGEPPRRDAGRESRRIEPSAAPPDESRPIPQGFTHRPPRNAPGLPPPIAPFLSDSEREELASNEVVVSRDAQRRANDELSALIDAFEAHATEGLVAELGERAREHARAGRLRHMSADELYRVFLFPNDPEQATAELRGLLVVLTALVAPHNMTDLADGFKLFEQTPYVHEPVLLATHQELAFVRCRLARPEEQKLRDWQEIHVIGFIEGKDRGDVVMDRCIVL